MFHLYFEAQKKKNNRAVLFITNAINCPMRWITPTVARREEKCDKENHRNQFNRKISENDMLQSYSLMDMWTLTSISINWLCASSTSCPWRSYKPLVIKCCLMYDRRLFCRKNNKVFLHMTLLCSDSVLFSIPLLHSLSFLSKQGPCWRGPRFTTCSWNRISCVFSLPPHTNLWGCLASHRLLFLL